MVDKIKDIDVEDFESIEYFGHLHLCSEEYCNEEAVIFVTIRILDKKYFLTVCDKHSENIGELPV